MSTHRKIEWALFILGLLGTAASFQLEASFIQTGLFGIGALFAGLHAFKLYDGHRANHVVVATSVALLGYTGYLSLVNLPNMMSEYAILVGLILSLLLSALSLRLRQDFHKA